MLNKLTRIIAIVFGAGVLLWFLIGFGSVEQGTDVSQGSGKVPPPPVEHPLLLTNISDGLTSEQQEGIAEYKKKILDRVGSGSVLTEKEKLNLIVVLSPHKNIFPNGDMLANQSVLQFSEAELQMISEARLRSE